MKHVGVGVGLAAVFVASVGWAAETTVMVRARTKDAKFIGTSMGGALLSWLPRPDVFRRGGVDPLPIEQPCRTHKNVAAPGEVVRLDPGQRNVREFGV